MAGLNLDVTERGELLVALVTRMANLYKYAISEKKSYGEVTESTKRDMKECISLTEKLSGALWLNAGYSFLSPKNVYKFAAEKAKSGL